MCNEMPDHGSRHGCVALSRFDNVFLKLLLTEINITVI